MPPTDRRLLARRLGRTLACVHQAGFDHPNLYAKHILIGSDLSRICFLDWQRSRRLRNLSWSRRWKDLAALHATLADDLAGPRDRLAVLHAYLQASLCGPLSGPMRKRWSRDAIRCIARQAERLAKHRHIRELRRSPLVPGTQQLVWLDGEALCVRPELRDFFTNHRPIWLATSESARTTVTVPGVSRATLVRQRCWSVANLWCWLRGRSGQSRPLRQAALLFRLQRYGIRAPRLLAFGQRWISPGRLDSFLLAEDPDCTRDLERELIRPVSSTAERKDRHRLIREIGTLLRNLHEAGCFLRSRGGLPLRIQSLPGEPDTVVLAGVDEIQMRRRAGNRHRITDLAQWLASLRLSGTDIPRLLRSYTGSRRLTGRFRRLMTLPRLPSAAVRADTRLICPRPEGAVV